MSTLLCLLLAASLHAAVTPTAALDTVADTLEANHQRDTVLDAMQVELARSRGGLKLEGFEPAYYIGYALRDSAVLSVKASMGAVDASGVDRARAARVDLRVGGYALDNSRVGLRSDMFDEDYTPSFAAAPLEDDPVALRTVLWRLSDARFKRANAEYFKKKAYLAARPDEKDRPDDFARVTPTVRVRPFSPVAADAKALEAAAREASLAFRAYPELDDANCEIQVTRIRRWFVDTEGTAATTQEQVATVGFHAESQAEDGMPISDDDDLWYRDASQLPAAPELAKRARAFAERFLRQRKALSQEPYTGPAILSGPAAGVFLHEVLGHRLEGERQKDEREGQTFKDKVGQPIMPDFLDLVDDPTQSALAGGPLAGCYEVDDQGVAAKPAVLVQGGVLKGFLMSRSPLKGFPHSNGHARGNGWYDPLGRMGNLILTAHKSVSEAELKRRLMAECARQGKPYGLRFVRIAGGETTTRRGDYQAFKGVPLEVYRIDAKTGAESLVRGVEIVGTPLSALNKILAAGDTTGVFNGVCGAGSGWVHVSAASPSLLIAELEVQGKDSTKRRHKVLKPPFAE